MYEPLWIRLNSDSTRERIHECARAVAPVVMERQQGAILTIDGYDNDEREIYEIPEVIDLFKRLVDEGLISLLEVSTSIEEMAPKGMELPYPGLGAFEVWSMANGKFSEWFLGQKPEFGEDMQGTAPTKEIKRFIEHDLMESNERLQQILDKPTPKDIWGRVLKNPPYKH